MIPSFLLAITVHEYAHGWAAYRFGDPTAKNAGRLTLNPLAHLDVLGTLCLLVTGMFGWAKPVPIDARNLRHPDSQMPFISMAGPVSNIILSLLAFILLYILFEFNLIVHIPLPVVVLQFIVNLLQFSLVINVSLAVLNLVPIPPLDGFHVLAYFLPENVVFFMRRYQVIFLILFVILLSQGFLSSAVYAITEKMMSVFK